MSKCRILYFRGGILEAAEDLQAADLFAATAIASSRNPHLTAEVWIEGRKVAIVRPSWHQHAQGPPGQ